MREPHRDRASSGSRRDSDGYVQTPVSYTILGWEHVSIPAGPDTIEVEYTCDSRSSTIMSLRHNGQLVDHEAWDARIWACEGHTVEMSACLPDGLPGWTEHSQEGPAGLCNLAWACRQDAIRVLLEAAGLEFDEEDAMYGYEMDDDGNLADSK